MFPTKYEDSSEEAPHKLIPRHQFSWNLSRILGDLPDFQVKSGTKRIRNAAQLPPSQGPESTPGMSLGSTGDKPDFSPPPPRPGLL